MGASKASRAMAQARKLMQDGDDEGETGSVRTCVVTRAKLAPDDLLRFVLSPEGIVTPDLRRKLPGRGVWVQTSRDAVAEALRRKAFTRGFKAPVNAPMSEPTTGTGIPTMAPTRPPITAPHDARRDPPYFRV